MKYIALLSSNKHVALEIHATGYPSRGTHLNLMQLNCLDYLQATSKSRVDFQDESSRPLSSEIELPCALSMFVLERKTLRHQNAVPQLF